MVSRADVIRNLMSKDKHKVGTNDPRRSYFVAPSPMYSHRGRAEVDGNYEQIVPDMRYNDPLAQHADVPNLKRRHTPHMLKRSNFLAPSVKSRAEMLGDAEYSASVEDIETSASESLLTQQIDISYPDRNDQKWLDERERLDDLGLHNVLPFGREQNKVKKRTNFADEFAQGLEHVHSVSEKLTLINRGVQEGVQETKRGNTILGAEIAKLLTREEVVSKLNARELQELYDKLKFVDIPSDWTKEFAHRFWSAQEYRKNKVRILLFMLSQRLTKEGISDPEKPIKRLVWDAKTSRFTRGKDLDISFLNAKMFMSDPGQPFRVGTRKKPAIVQGVKQNLYIDLKNNAVVPVDFVIQSVRTGVDGGKMNGLIVPHAPDDEKEPEIIPVGIFNPVYSEARKFSDKRRQEMGVNIRAPFTRELVPVPMFQPAKAVVETKRAVSSGDI